MFWGLGMQSLMGFAMDPLALVVSFFVTARAVSHSVQIHERYYDEYKKWNWDKEKAIVASFAELFVPTSSGIITDALGMLVIIMVPVVILQNIAISGLLLALWMIISFLGSCTLVPAIIVLTKPKFFLRAVEEGIVG